MQTRVKLSGIQSLAKAKQSQFAGQEQKVQHSAHLLTFTPVDTPADGTQTGDMHLGGATAALQVLVAGDAEIQGGIGKEFMLTLTPA